MEKQLLDYKNQHYRMNSFKEFVLYYMLLLCSNSPGLGNWKLAAGVRCVLCEICVLTGYLQVVDKHI